MSCLTGVYGHVITIGGLRERVKYKFFCIKLPQKVEPYKRSLNISCGNLSMVVAPY